MADGFTVKSGIRQLRKDIRRVADHGLEADLQRTNKALAKFVQKRAQKNAPKLTGALEKGIKASGTKTGAKVRSGSTGKSKTYARYQHFDRRRYGHLASFMYLYDAGEESNDTVQKRYVQVIERQARYLAKNYAATEEL